MSLPAIIKDIESRAKDTGDTITGDLTFKKVENGKSKIYKNHSDTADYGLQLLDETQDGLNTARLILCANPNRDNLAFLLNGTNYLLYGEHNKPTPADIGAKPVESTTFNLGGNYVAVRTPGRTTDQYYEFWDSNIGWADIKVREVYAGNGVNKVYHAGNKPTPADIGAATSGHNHDSAYYGASVSRTANTVLAAPNGSAGGATFRTLVAADIPNLAASKITSGTLGVARGGTGATTFTSGAALIGAGTGAVTTRAITNNTALTSAISRNTNLVTMNTLSYALGRTTNPTQADTNYTTYMVRAIAANTSALTAGSSTLASGTIYVQYES